MTNQKRGRIQPRTNKVSVTEQAEHIPSEDAKKLYNDFVADLRKRQLSSSENFDKSILTYSSGGLAVSLTFLKDFIPVSGAEASWLLYGSWTLFSVAIIATIVSFLVSYEAQERMQKIAERYYIEGDESAFDEKSNFDLAITWLNYFSGGAFILALIFTTLFVSTNLHKAEAMKDNRKPISEGLNAPLMQKIGNTEFQKGLPTATLQKIPTSSKQTPIPAPAPTPTQKDK